MTLYSKQEIQSHLHNLMDREKKYFARKPLTDFWVDEFFMEKAISMIFLRISFFTLYLKLIQWPFEKYSQVKYEFCV